MINVLLAYLVLAARGPCRVGEEYIADMSLCLRRERGDKIVVDKVGGIDGEKRVPRRDIKVENMLQAGPNEFTPAPTPSWWKLVRGIQVLKTASPSPAPTVWTTRVPTTSPSPAPTLPLTRTPTPVPTLSSKMRRMQRYFGWVRLSQANSAISDRTAAPHVSGVSDCAVSTWGQWSICSVNGCGYGNAHRARSVLQPPSITGKMCPTLFQFRRCFVSCAPTPVPTPGCIPGRYQQATPLAQSAQIHCRPCPRGRYSTGNARRCTKCPPGRFGVGASTSSRCTGGCGPGRYGFFGAYTSGCVGACPAGRFNPGGSNSTNCRTACPAGRFSARGARGCDVCPSGQMTEHSGQATCSSGCPAGRYPWRVCKRALARKDTAHGIKSCQTYCMQCSPGRFQLRAKAKLCKACPWGKYQAHVGSTSCASCPEGKYQPVAGRPLCLVRSETRHSCTAGRYFGLAQKLVGAHVRICQDCPSGKYQPQPKQHMCLTCAVGKSTTAAGEKSGCVRCTLGTEASSNGCSLCPAGQYGHFIAPANNTAAFMQRISTCAKCTPGRFADGLGQHSCSSCPRGHFASREGTIRCSICPQGKLQRFPGLPFCNNHPCPRGKFSVLIHHIVALSRGGSRAHSIHRKVSCSSCSRNTFQQHKGALRCQSCPSGKYQPFTGQSSCFSNSTKCPPGRYVSCTGYDSVRCNSRMECLVCPRGTFQPLADQVTCIRCPHSKFSTPNATACWSGAVALRPKRRPKIMTPQSPFVALSSVEHLASASIASGPVPWPTLVKSGAIIMQMKDATTGGFPESVCSRMCATTVGCSWWVRKAQVPHCLWHRCEPKASTACCGYADGGTCFLLKGQAHNITASSQIWTAGLPGSTKPFQRAATIRPRKKSVPVAGEMVEKEGNEKKATTTAAPLRATPWYMVFHGP